MRKSYFRRRSALLSSPGRIAAAAAVIALLLGAGILRVFAPGAFFAAAGPVFALGTGASWGVSGFFGAFGDAAEKEARIRALESEVRALMNANEALTARLLDAGAPMETEAVIYAGVIARPPLSPYDMLIVGAGAADGVLVGALSTAEGGVPVGIVTSVAQTTSQISLFSTPGQATEGWVGDERLPITLVGTGGGTFSAELARDAVVAVDEVVYLPGPGALPVGRIVEVETDPASPSATIRIEPSVNVFSLSLVAIRVSP